MKKQVKKWGNNIIVSFTQEEQRIYGIREDSILDLSEMIVEKGEEVL